VSGQPRIGFLGVGGMGAGMVSRLLAAGYPVTVKGNRNRAPIEAALAQGAREAVDVPSLARGADVLVLCVRTAEIAEALVAEAAPHLAAGALVIDTGTAPPEVPRRLHALLAGRGVDFVEAPLTGGVTQAAAGSLGALVGAEPGALEKARPVLAAFCATIRHFGAPGQAATAKLLNNYMVMGIVALIAETFGKAAQAGVAWRDLYEVAIRGSGDSGALRRILPGAIEGDFGGYVFDLAGAKKDLDYFRAAAEGLGGESALAAAVHAVYTRAVEAGHGDCLMGDLLRPDIRAELETDR
jgi:3-hydroxyisobutyrate dehydrogenase-like beta-hydroxyacid dehydrogenase